MSCITLNRAYRGYYTIITLLNAITIVLCFGLIGITCNGMLFSKCFYVALAYIIGFHWYIIQIIDIGQSIWILIAARQLIKLIDIRVGSQYNKIGGNLAEDRQYSCLISQMRSMSIGSLVFCMISSVFLTTANIMNHTFGEMIFCRLDWYLIPVTNSGSVLMVLHTLYFYAFSILVWYVFYKIPYRHGLIFKRQARTVS